MFRYKRISKSLNLYKTGVLKETILAIGNFHRSALETQKFFIHGIRSLTNESWQNHIDIFRCLYEWMTTLLELFGCTKLDDTDVNKPIPTTTPPLVTDSVNATTNDNFSVQNNKGNYLMMYRKKDRWYYYIF